MPVLHGKRDSYVPIILSTLVETCSADCFWFHSNDFKQFGEDGRLQI